MSHIQLNYAFLLFWSIFGKIHREFLFYVLNYLSQKRALKYSEMLFFLTCLKRVNPDVIWICLKNSFWSNQWKGTNINKNCFSPQSEPHTAKLCYSVVLKHFWENSLRTSLFSQKVTISERSTEILRRFFFLNMFKKGKSWRKFGFV